MAVSHRSDDESSRWLSFWTLTATTVDECAGVYVCFRGFKYDTVSILDLLLDWEMNNASEQSRLQARCNPAAFVASCSSLSTHTYRLSLCLSEAMSSVWGVEIHARCFLLDLHHLRNDTKEGTARALKGPFVCKNELKTLPQEEKIWIRTTSEPGWLKSGSFGRSPLLFFLGGYEASRSLA